MHTERTTLLRDEATVAGRLVVIVGAVGLAIWLLLQVVVVTVGAFFGLALAAMLWPVVSRLRRYMPQFLAMLLSVLAFISIFGVGLWFLGSELLRAVPQLSSAIGGGLQSMLDWAQNIGPGLPSDLTDQLTSWLGGLASEAGSAAVTGLGAVTTFITILILILFVLIFALLGGDGLAKAGVGMLPERWHRRATSSVKALAGTARAWIFASTVTGIADGLLIGIGLWILGVPLAVPIGMLTFFAGFIPTIGAFFAGAVAVVVALFSGGITTALWALLIVLAVQQIQGNVLEPLLLSKAMDFHPLVTLLLTTTGGLAFGLVGLLLTVPVVGLVVAGIHAWKHPDGADENAAERSEPHQPPNTGDATNRSAAAGVEFRSREV